MNGLSFKSSHSTSTSFVGDASPTAHATMWQRRDFSSITPGVVWQEMILISGSERRF